MHSTTASKYGTQGAIRKAVLCLFFSPRPNTVRLRPQRVRPFISVYIDLAGCLMAALPPCQWLQLPKGELNPPQQFVSACHAHTHTRPHKKKGGRWTIFLPILLIPQWAFFISKLVSLKLFLHPSCRRHLEEAPLMTKALRESQMREKMERYPKVSTSDRHRITILLLNVRVCMKYTTFEYLCLSPGGPEGPVSRQTCSTRFLQATGDRCVCLCVCSVHFSWLATGMAAMLKLSHHMYYCSHTRVTETEIMRQLCNSRD